MTASTSNSAPTSSDASNDSISSSDASSSIVVSTSTHGYNDTVVLTSSDTSSSIVLSKSLVATKIATTLPNVFLTTLIPTMDQNNLTSTPPTAAIVVPIITTVVCGVTLLVMIVTCVLAAYYHYRKLDRSNKNLYTSHVKKTCHLHETSLIMVNTSNIEAATSVAIMGGATSEDPGTNTIEISHLPQPNPVCNETDTSSNKLTKPSVLSDATKKHTPFIDTVSFHCHVQDMHMNGNKAFELEYLLLKGKPDKSQTVAALSYRCSKNRFLKVMPCEDEIVKLKEINEMPDSDYINASYIDGYKQENCYIISQVPTTECTTANFWKLVWEQQLQTLVLLTKCSEDRKRICEMYWSDSVGGVYETETLTVTTVSILLFAEFDIRKFFISNKVATHADTLQVTHFCCTAWSHHRLSQSVTSILSLLRRVNKVHDKSKGIPLLIHCTAGVARMGTFIALDILLDMVKSEVSINVFEVVKNIRMKQVLMVQSLAQYMFIYDALDEYIMCGDTSINAINLRASMNSLSKIEPEKCVNGFQKQFTLLNTMRHKPNPDEFTNGAQPFSTIKNRHKNRLPYSVSCPLLAVARDEGSNYINASFVDAYNQRKAYIATQGPLHNTVEEFWRMVWEQKCRVIVMLCPLKEGGRESSYCYWPTEEKSTVSYGSICVTLESTQSCEAYKHRRFVVLEKSEQQDSVITQLHYTEWPEHGQPTNTASMMELMNTLIRTQNSTGNKPILVHCNDGVGRTGTFITIYSEVERLKAEGEIDVFQRVKLSRIARPGLVKNVEQYTYCYECLAHFVGSC